MKVLYRVAVWAAVGVAVAVVAIAAALASSEAKAMSLARSTNGGGACGVERWTVKTLQDRPRLLPAQKTTIHYLITRRAPSSLPDTRLPFEGTSSRWSPRWCSSAPRRTATCTSCSSRAATT
jgi:hypothetical protein